MEKKYLIGYLYGNESVIWDDVKDFSETMDPNTGKVTLSFTEDDIDFEYVGNENKGYHEIHRKGPFITSYKMVGRRTARRHDYLNPEKRRPVDTVPHRPIDTIRREPHHYSDTSYTSCGAVMGNCGFSSYRDSYMGHCGYYGGCGGGHC